MLDLGIKTFEEYSLCFERFKAVKSPLTVEALVGGFIHLYRIRTGVVYGKSPRLMKELFQDMRCLWDQYGEQAYAYLEVLMTYDEMRWVRNHYVSFLLNEKNIYRFIVPLMGNKKKKPGEQAEWTKERGKAEAKKISWQRAAI